MVRPLCCAALLLLGSAAGAPADDLSAALVKARTSAVTGQVEVTVLFPPRSTPATTLRRLPPVPFRPQLLRRNFDVVRVGPARLAGRDVQRYELTPRTGQAGRWTLWIDPVWKLPLGFEERREDGSLARRAQFVRADGAQPVARPLPPVPPGLRAAVLKALPGLQLPPGFVPVALRAREQTGYVITLSDGANVLALTTAARPVKAAPGVASRWVGRRAVWLVGNLPPAALNRALAGVRRIDEAALSVEPQEKTP